MQCVMGGGGGWRGGVPQSVVSQVGNRGIWDNCCGSQSPVCPGTNGELTRVENGNL